MTDPFPAQLASWQAYVDTPWARLRYAVVEEVLRREAAALGQGLRVLDVGGGDGRDALPLAVAGHDVTLLDRSASWVAEAQRRAEAAGAGLRAVVADLTGPPDLGVFDLVLCHFVLQYVDDLASTLGRLAGWVRPGGIVSVMVPNPVGMVLRRLVSEGPGAALAELDSTSAHTVTFDHETRKLPMPQLEDALRAAGLSVVRRYGARVANDLLVDDAAKSDPDHFRQLLDLELALCDREPYLRLGGHYQLVATRAEVRPPRPPG